MNFISAAMNGARHINRRIAQAQPEVHRPGDVPGDESTEYLQNLSDELLAEYRAKLRHRPFVQHPNRPNTWVREISDRDRHPSSVRPSSLGPGRNLPEGGEAA